MEVNVYDFDKTIYDGDCSIDFFKFCIKKNKKVIINILPSFVAAVLYLLKLENKEYFKGVFFRFVKYFDDIDTIIDQFWKENEYKIKRFYRELHKESDYVISASPEFLLTIIANKYKFNLIATIVSKKDGTLISKNCYGKEKVERFKSEKEVVVNNFYSDSLSDQPFRDISKNGFMVKGEKISNWENYKKK